MFAGHASVSDVVFGMACCVVVGTGELVAVKEVTVSVPVTAVDSSRSQAQVAASAAGGGSPSNANVRHRRHVESSAAASSLTAVTREADLLRSLQHDNIVRCLGTLSGADVPTSSHNLARRQRGDDDGDIDGNAATTTADDGTASGTTTACILMEYVSGGSLHAAVREFGALSEDVIAKYTGQVLSALEHMHSKGVVHGDVKGANILLTNTGVAKLADFGCARLVCEVDGSSSSSCSNNSAAANGRVTRSTPLQGTVPFMAPEGEWRWRVDAASLCSRLVGRGWLFKLITGT